MGGKSDSIIDIEITFVAKLADSAFAINCQSHNPILDLLVIKTTLKVRRRQL
jgi:hypothetical protein